MSFDGEVVMGDKVILKAENISKTYGRGKSKVEAVKDTCLELEQGKFYAVLGRSGCGKSTLLHLLSTLDRPDSGAVYLRGEEITGLKDARLSEIRRKGIGFVFQSYQLLPEFTALENICMPFYLAGEKPDEVHIESLMRVLDIWDLRERFMSEMSGGERQRTAIGRAMAMKPAVIFADEPTGNLDAANGREVAAMLRKAADEFGQTILMVTHDESMKQYADVVFYMRDGRIGGADELDNH